MKTQSINRRHKAPQKSVQQIRIKCDEIANRLHIQQQADWYKVSKLDFKTHGGESLLRCASNSLHRLLQKAYKEFKWNIEEFKVVPQNHWKQQHNQKAYLDWLCSELQIEEQPQLYSITRGTIVQHGGRGLIYHYKESVWNMFSSIYTQYEWFPWLFSQVPERYWDNKDNQREYMEWLARELSLQSPDDWFFVSKDMIRQHGGGGLLHHYNQSLLKLLEASFPQQKWTHVWALSKGQSNLSKQLQKLIKQEMHSNFKMWIHERGKQMELDVYFPSLQLAFEYQGQQHYTAEDHMIRDEEKKEVCLQRGITLIEIPYWWDMSLKSLIATIRSHRADITLHIPNNLCLNSHVDSNINSTEASEASAMFSVTT